MQPYTVALTSCGRFDLLERTLRSLLPRLDGPLRSILIADDSGENAGGLDRLIETFKSDDVPIDAVVNSPPIGQIASIDRLYGLVDTDWVFHCEDDWEFLRTGFIRESFELLMENETLSMAALRDVSDYGQVSFGPERQTSSGIGYRVADTSLRSESHMSGLHFNPGLRRMADYHRIGPYAQLPQRPPIGEVTVSGAYRDTGLRVGVLVEPAVRHIGDGRHIRDPFQRRGLLYRMRRSARKRWLRLQDRLEARK